ncbi:MAG: conjugal transfer protein TraX [Clostridiales bacterium]|nr:conjugal transfer protein TraX [Clostridiales bacterium]
MSKKEKKPKVIKKVRLEEKGLTAYELKALAMFTMVLDHVAYIWWRPLGNWGQVMRVLGRFTFPLMVFLLTEGFIYTRNRYVYVIRIMITAMLSMLPYKLAFNENMLNVIFTLGAGLLILMAEEASIRRFTKIPPYAWQFIYLLVAGGTAYLMRDFDWGLPGVLAIYVTGQLKHRPYWIQAFGCCGTLLLVTILRRIAQGRMFTTSYCIFISSIALAGIWICLYNGRRGNDRKYQKYAFYAFYPLHLLVLYMIRTIL